MECSVIVTTSNRAASLAKTLRAFSDLSIPLGWRVELIVVDNASKDRTAEVVREAPLKEFHLRYLYEGRPGKSNGLNAALAAARGEVLLFTDDDVIPATDWLERLARPLLQLDCDAAVGRIRLAQHLARPWMGREHRHWLAAPDAMKTDTPEFIGANMGFHRSVLRHVPAFDPELGPGAAGMGEELLFSLQLREAGLRMRSINEAVVFHQPDSSRLLRSQWLATANKHARAAAYILYHWEHAKVQIPLARACFVEMKLRLRRLLQRPPEMDAEGCPPWEMSYSFEIAKWKAFAREQRQPRNYLRHGLTRL